MFPVYLAHSHSNMSQHGAFTCLYRNTNVTSWLQHQCNKTYTRVISGAPQIVTSLWTTADTISTFSLENTSDREIYSSIMKQKQVHCLAYKCNHGNKATKSSGDKEYICCATHGGVYDSDINGQGKSQGKLF